MDLHIHTVIQFGEIAQNIDAVRAIFVSISFNTADNESSQANSAECSDFINNVTSHNANNNNTRTTSDCGMYASVFIPICAENTNNRLAKIIAIERKKMRPSERDTSLLRQPRKKQNAAENQKKITNDTKRKTSIRETAETDKRFPCHVHSQNTFQPRCFV